MDGKCDGKCAVAECGYDGMDCNKNMFFRDLTESNTIGIIFNAPPAEILDKIYLLLAKLAQVNYFLEVKYLCAIKTSGYIIQIRSWIHSNKIPGMNNGKHLY